MKTKSPDYLDLYEYLKARRLGKAYCADVATKLRLNEEKKLTRKHRRKRRGVKKGDI